MNSSALLTTNTKTLDLKTAYELIKNSVGLILNNHEEALVYPTLKGIENDPENDFIVLFWTTENGERKCLGFPERFNNEVELENGILTLTSDTGNPEPITLLVPAQKVPQNPLPTFQSCVFVEATDIVPRHWDNWFWTLISESAPFSWGNNNRTMVTASDFRHHCEERLEYAEDAPRSEIEDFLNSLAALGETYLDLEN